MEWRSVGVSLCGALSIFTPELALAQLAHPGYSGLISTPNAEVVRQGQVALGFSWIDGLNTYLFAPMTNRVYVVTAGVLPGLEATLRQTQVIGWHDPDASGVEHAFDRMFSAKYSPPLPEGYPQAAIGVQDIASGNFLTGVNGVRPGATQYGQTMLYGVIGKRYTSWAWHSGVGSSQSFINGIFGGISYYPLKQLSVHGEWDTKELNIGIRISLQQGWWIQLSSIHGTTWSAGSGIFLDI